MRLKTRSGKYSAEIYYLAPDGRRKRKLLATGIVADGTRQSRTTAERIGRELEERHAWFGQGPRESGPTLRQAYVARVEALRLADRSPSTINITYTKMVHVVRFFGLETDVTTLTDESLREYATYARKKRKPSTVYRELVELRCAMKSVSVTPPKMPALGAAAVVETWLTAEQTSRMLSYIPLSRWPSDRPTRREYVLTYRLLGLCWKELYRIAPHEINYERNTVRVRGTKRKTRDRPLPMPPQVRELFQRWPPPWPLWANNNINACLTKAARKAGVVDENTTVTVNVLRASFCTDLVLRDVSAIKIARLMGHRTTRMVDQVYTRLRTGEHLQDVLSTSQIRTEQGVPHGREGHTESGKEGL